MEHVYLVWHEHEMPNGDDDTKFIGAYRTRADAEAAVRRTEVLQGFSESKDGFLISERELGKDEWTSGYFTAHDPAPELYQLVENWREYDVGLDVSVGDEDSSRSVTIRGSREALTMLSVVLSRLAETEANSIALTSAQERAGLLAQSSLGLRIERVGHRRSMDFQKYGTFDSIRGIYDVQPEN